MDTLHDPNTRDVARLEKSVKKHQPIGDWFQLFLSRATSQVFGSEYSNTKKNIRYSFYKITTVVILKKNAIWREISVFGYTLIQTRYWPVRPRVVYLLFYNQLSFPFVIAFKFSCILSRFSNIRSDMSMIVYVYIIHLLLVLTRTSHELAK